MRTSCNGCRVLRKGCSEDCSIRPCLQWIKNPESQKNATLFLAKFYGRAGLLNLITAGPVHLRPAIFRSLLYEASGRMVNPVYGATGLLCTGSWQLCQEAVEEILKGNSAITIKETSNLGENSRKLFKRSAKRRVLSPQSSAMSSEETVEESALESDVELELKLGFEPAHRGSSSSCSSSHNPAGIRREDLEKKSLELDLPA